jgi:hypothetical protein
MTSAEVIRSKIHSAMFQSLFAVVVTCAIVGSAIAGVPAPQVGIVPSIAEDKGKITYRQASKAEILRRAESRRIAARGVALQPRQSAKVYPTCSSGSPGYIPQSGFVSFPNYAIDANSANLLVS